MLFEKNEVINAFDKIGRDEINLDELDSPSVPYLKDIAMLWKKFQNYKQNNDQMDFNDLLIEVRNLLIQNKEVAKKWKDKYKFYIYWWISRHKQYSIWNYKINHGWGFKYYSGWRSWSKYLFMKGCKH